MMKDMFCSFPKATGGPFLDKGRLLQSLFALSCPTERCRLRDLLHLSFDFATHLLQAETKEDVLATVLVAVTAGEGLGFNRAFVLEKAEDANELRGLVGLGPPSPEAAAEIWGSIEAESPSFPEMVARAREEIWSAKPSLGPLASSLRISLDSSHGFLRALEELKALRLHQEDEPLLEDLFTKLGVQEIAIVPLGISPWVYGFLLVDNFVTCEPIQEENLQFLKILAAQVSLALNRLNLCQELESQKGLLVEAERLAALGQVASKIFHEIRNPISAVGGLSRLLVKKGVGRDLQGYLETIMREAARLEQVLEDLFEFIRPVKLKPQPVGLYRLLQTALNLLYADFREAGIHVALDILDKEPVVCVDQEEMRLVLLHLLKNALEAMPEGGALRIKVRAEDGVVIEITDSGTGIPKAYLNRVTEPFFTTKTYGSGLGLSVAKRIVELHGGSLELVPAKPSGTKAIVRLPAEVICNGGHR